MQRLAVIMSLIVLYAAFVAHEALVLSPAERLSIRYHYNLVAWEAFNLPSKWVHWLANATSPIRQTPEERMATVNDYFGIQGELGSLQRELEQAVATGSNQVTELEERVESVRRRANTMLPQVEEFLEGGLTEVLRQEGIPLRIGNLMFPPVDFALDRLPTLLVVSPRDTIRFDQSVLLKPELSPTTRNAIETRIEASDAVSALVEGLGGISTYPTIIASTDLRTSLILASHEWLHNYLFFRPLGQSYAVDGNMSSINETTANVFGEELGNLVFSRLTGEPVPTPSEPGPAQPCPDDQFCFNKEMRETRLRVDELLAESRVEDAEAYMEQRRKVFVDNGYYLRRLNQAYFAFHGTYAESGASASPVGGLVREYRDLSPDLGSFISRVASMSSYERFVTDLDALKGGS